MLISNSLYVYINFITTKIKFISLILKAQEKKRDEKKNCKSVIPVMLVVRFVGDNKYDKEVLGFCCFCCICYHVHVRYNFDWEVFTNIEK